MNNLFGLRESDIQNISDILNQFNEVSSAVIFGSRAKGNFTRGSDVDIAIKGEGLNLRITNKIGYILNEETLMPYKFDVIDYNTITNPELKSHIKRAGIEFYKKDG